MFTQQRECRSVLVTSTRLSLSGSCEFSLLALEIDPGVLVKLQQLKHAKDFLMTAFRVLGKKQEGRYWQAYNLLIVMRCGLFISRRSSFSWGLGEHMGG